MKISRKSSVVAFSLKHKRMKSSDAGVVDCRKEKRENVAHL